MNQLKSSRIETLDWLRGLMALSIMFYHVTFWTIRPMDSSNPLGRLGIYGVSIFFVLSGLSMAIVYNHYIKSIQTSAYFFIRRIFRIWPLLWIACFFTVLPPIIKSGTYSWDSWKLLFLNITTLFGFIDPTAYIATGAWSIGNEMVYYALTPLIFLMYNYKKWFGNIFFTLCLCIGFFFAFYALDPTMNLDKQWALYVNPFNNLFLYVMGIAIYYNFKDTVITPMVNNLLLCSAVLLFCLLPFEGNQISIVSGPGRVAFVLLSFIIVLCFYKLQINLPPMVSNALETFGIATYGVYLIHPIVFSYSNFLLKQVNISGPFVLFSLVSILTITISIYSYRLIELKFIQLGKKLTSSPVK